MSDSRPLDRPRVLLAGIRDDTPEQIELRTLAEVVYITRPLTDASEQSRHIDEAVKAHGPFVAYADSYSKGGWLLDFGPTMLHSLAPDCKCYASIAVGYDHHDLPWMNAKTEDGHSGAWSCNAPLTNQRITADGTITHVLNVFRGLRQMDAEVRAGHWQNYAIKPIDWRGKTLGILGLGGIGRRVADACHALGMSITYHGRQPKTDVPKDYQYLDRDEFWGSFDCLCVCCPQTPETKNLVDRAAFAKMKDGVMLVTTSRGSIVDENALIEALNSGKVSRAGLDVFENEPNIPAVLRENPNVTLTPHMMFLADTLQAGMNAEILRNIIAYLKTGRPLTPVNDPTAPGSKSA